MTLIPYERANLQRNVKEIKLTTPSDKRRKDNTSIFGTDFNVQRNVEKKRLTSDERTNVQKRPEDYYLRNVLKYGETMRR